MYLQYITVVQPCTQTCICDYTGGKWGRAWYTVCHKASMQMISFSRPMQTHTDAQSQGWNCATTLTVLERQHLPVTSCDITIAYGSDWPAPVPSLCSVPRWEGCSLSPQTLPKSQRIPGGVSAGEHRAWVCGGELQFRGGQRSVWKQRAHSKLSPTQINYSLHVF